MSSETITNRLENIAVDISKLKSELRTFHAEKKTLNQKLINLESGNFMGDSCPTLAQINDTMEQISNLEQKIRFQAGMLKKQESLYSEAQLKLKQYDTARIGDLTIMESDIRKALMKGNQPSEMR